MVNSLAVGVKQRSLQDPICSLVLTKMFSMVSHSSLGCVKHTLPNGSVPDNVLADGVHPIFPDGTSRGFEVAMLSLVVVVKAG